MENTITQMIQLLRDLMMMAMPTMLILLWKNPFILNELIHSRLLPISSIYLFKTMTIM